MTEIDVVQDLNTVTEQVQKLNSQLQETNNQSAVLVQQIQNLNGVLMYLRGKEVSSEPVNETVVEDSSNSEE
jgi:hypothetical protein